MDTALAVAIGSFLLAVISFVLFLYFFFFRYRTDFSGITQLSMILDARLRDEDSASMLNDAIDSFYQLGALAQNANAILSDEETFDGLLTEFAGRVRKSIMGSMMGTASGDVKKMARAERLLNDAIVDSAQQIMPELGMLLKVSGLDEELKADPELLGYILQIAEKNGLMNMLNKSVMNVPSREQQEKIHEKLGIEF